MAAQTVTLHRPRACYMLGRWLLLVVTVAAMSVLGITAAACSSEDDDEAASGNGGGSRTLTVATSKDKLIFTPSTLRVKVGEPVTITLDNTAGTVLHDFTIDEMEVSDVSTEGGAEHMMDSHGGHGNQGNDGMPIGGPMGGNEMGMGGFALHVAAATGMTATIEFTPEERGEYTYYCTVEGHQQASMEGTLIVE